MGKMLNSANPPESGSGRSCIGRRRRIQGAPELPVRDGVSRSKIVQIEQILRAEKVGLIEAIARPLGRAAGSIGNCVTAFVACLLLQPLPPTQAFFGSC